jgi:alpha-tubulin suppressor-like RCC1 family protein
LQQHRLTTEEDQDSSDCPNESN